MLRRLNFLKFGILMTKRGLILNVILFFILYMLYFVFSLYIPLHFIPSGAYQLVVQALYNFVIVIGITVTSFFIHKYNKLRVICVCAIVITTLAPFLFFVSNGILRLTLIFGVALFSGVWQLTFLTYFWSLTVPEERGRVAGFIVFVSLLLNLVTYTVVEGILNYSMSIILGIILSLSALILVLLRPKRTSLTTKKDEKEGYYSEKRTILLYIGPWVLFSFINATLAKNISFHISNQVPSSPYLFLTILQIIATIFGALAGGVIADFFGRRGSLAFSLTLYGISSALAGIGSNYALLCFVYVANGLSWGILFVMYSFVIWGDLANKKNFAKVYAVGLITLYLTQGIGFLPLQQILQIPLVVSSLLSCLLIFLSIIPIFLAPELLPAVFREKVRLKTHLRAVKKISKKSKN
jgi:MFS family permease